MLRVIGNLKNLRHRYGIYLVNLLRGILCRVPLGVSRAVLGFLGEAAFLVRRKDRAQTLSNLRTAFGDSLGPKEIERLAKLSYRNLGYSLAEFLQFPRGDAFFKTLQFDFPDRGILDQLVEEGRGCVFVTAHVGNWELLAAWFARQGYPVNVVARLTRDHRMEDVLQAYRAAGGAKVLWRGISTRGMLRILRSGEGLGILGDLDTKGEGVFIPFFGRSAYTQIGPAKLAARTGAPLVTGFIARTGPRSHKIRVTRCVRVSEDPVPGDRSVNVMEAVRIYTDEIESWIRKYPDQWIWMHARWKTTGERIARRKARQK
jgi:KDO2-lipid IV(A) lauroyltransferase